MIRAKIVRRFAPGQDSPGFELDVDFEVSKGVTVMYGHSGSGKTLTLECIAGFITPDRGRIIVDDRILFDRESGVCLPPQQRACGYVFQNYALFPHMTLRENLAFAANALPRLERHRRIAEQLERFKLSQMAGRYPREMSGGQKQRGSIARALIAQPKLLLLDEPGRGLDAELRNDLYSLIRDLKDGAEAPSVPIVLVTHDPEECFALADQVLIYENGRIIHRGTPLDLLRNPGSTEAARLLGGFDVFDAEVIAIDPAHQTSRLRLLGEDIAGPNLRGCFKGDRVAVCVRPEELQIRTQPGENCIRGSLKGTLERPQGVRADFGNGMVVDVARETWRNVEPAGTRSGWWIEFPAQSLRQIQRGTSG